MLHVNYLCNIAVKVLILQVEDDMCYTWRLSYPGLQRFSVMNTISLLQILIVPLNFAHQPSISRSLPSLKNVLR